MAIRTVVTRGYGNGTFNGTIALVTLRGYQSNLEVAGAVRTASFEVATRVAPSGSTDTPISPSIELGTQVAPSDTIAEGS